MTPHWLLRSGLYMAGAASMVYGQTSKSEDEDGILTAKDIADLEDGFFDSPEYWAAFIILDALD